MGKRLWKGLVQGCYGPFGDRQGVCGDHVSYAVEDGYVLRRQASGRVVLAKGADVAPVVCAELIETWSEDGPSDGRCGLPVVGTETLMCAGHADEMAEWRAMTESDRARWERAHEEAL